MTTGPEQLRDWLQRRGFNQREGANLLEMDDTHLCRILSGERTPTLQQAVAIQRLTGISVETWANDDALAVGSRKPSK